jgi:hypothetical protein
MQSGVKGGGDCRRGLDRQGKTLRQKATGSAPIPAGEPPNNTLGAFRMPEVLRYRTPRLQTDEEFDRHLPGKLGVDCVEDAGGVAPRRAEDDVRAACEDNATGDGGGQRGTGQAGEALG